MNTKLATDTSPIPRKLNQGMITALSEYIKKGNYLVTAAQLCHVDENTVYRWMQLANADLVASRETLYTALYRSLKSAEAEAESLMVETARNAAVEKKDGYLAITVNERRHPDRWGRRERKTIDIREHRIIEISHSEVVKDYGHDQQIETGGNSILDNK
ncbi:hypothetical protein LCGC14_1575610 [marine sediment metagenome]|uniref:Uncharacterized protein n=1 Tax=marine sediment metagenome TaxID=412755 RepID=A0A0F9KZC0_9ZZZZ